MQTAWGRAFDNQYGSATTLFTELRTRRGLSLVSAARGLRLGADVWKKFEQGAIDLVSLSERQLERLARFFDVSAEQFGLILNNSQPSDDHQSSSKQRRRTQRATKPSKTEFRRGPRQKRHVQRREKILAGAIELPRRKVQ